MILTQELIDKKTLQKLYLEDKLFDREIANIYKVNTISITRLRKKYNIKTLEYQERSSLPSCFSCFQKEFLLGTLLGDGCISYAGKSKYPRFSVGHTIKQLPYLQYKFEIMKDFTKAPIRFFNYSDGTRCIFKTLNNPAFEEIYNLFYRNSKKVITKELLDQLTLLSLTIWYQDDGSYHKQGFIRIATHSFSYEEHLLIQKYFKDKWDIEVKIYKHSRINKDGNVVYYLYFSVKETQKFIKLIKPYIIPPMNYKIGGEKVA